ncbi:hypothetical protein [Spirosoma endbachense]|uniref:Uncharacterized protein n=1 Tax=Spirosoma endbachense TaxID=2666025 RepID=A0A6P1W1N3_9BACT|nr:hypothetical protein [Spirosoma endbachense]QHV97890.1 hypothetical protein GJR95_24060 [Spirosoma endbachense]
MAKLSTSKAIDRILHEEGFLLIWLKAGYSKAYRRQCRHRLRQGRLSKGIQEKILSQLGFTPLVVETRWDIPRYP